MVKSGLLGVAVCDWCGEKTKALVEIQIEGGEWVEVCEDCKLGHEEKRFDV